MKVCNRCLKEKELDEFFRDSACLDGRYSMCKVCKTQSTIKWRSENTEKYNASMRAYNKKNWKRIHYRRQYNLTPEQYEAMLEAQGRCCAICKKTNANGKRPFVVDHSHTTKKIRGILCYGCNRALSTLEKPELLQSAMQYLLK